MSKTIYALLVGINDYPKPIRQLYGCVNDVNAMHAFLENYVNVNSYIYKPLLLLNAYATRNGIINGFKNHLMQASANDAVVFYYSGHGSQQDTPPEFWHIEPDKLNETIVCYDSRTNGSWDLADKEISKLIYDLAATNPHITIILDCCHSGGSTRANVVARQAIKDERVRPYNSFITTAEQLSDLAPVKVRSNVKPLKKFVSLPIGRHLLLSACLSSELAQELPIEGNRRGIFSYYLLDTLQRSQGNVTYRNLFNRADALVRSHISLQTPQIDATDITDIDQLFLCGNGTHARPNFTMSYEKNNWVVDAGKVHGVLEGQGSENTLLTIFPFNIADDLNKTPPFGLVKVEKVYLKYCIVSVVLWQQGSGPDVNTTYVAHITGLPINALNVFLDGDESQFTALHAAFIKTVSAGAPAVIAFTESSEAFVKVVKTSTEYCITQTVDSYSLGLKVNLSLNDAEGFVLQQLEQIARWLQLMQLNNIKSNIPQNAIQVTIDLVDGIGNKIADAASLNYRFAYKQINGNWVCPKVQVRLKNNSSQKFYVALLNMRADYGIFPVLDGGGVWLAPGAETYVKNNGNTVVSVYIPDDLWNKGITELADSLKAVISTEKFEASLLYQQGLKLSAIEPQAKCCKPKNNLDHLLTKVGMRSMSEPQFDELVVDWTTLEITYKIIRPK